MTKLDTYKTRVIDATLRGNQLYLSQVGMFRQISERRNEGLNVCLFEYRIPKTWTTAKNENSLIQKDISLEMALAIVDNNINHVAVDWLEEQFDRKHFDR